ncbi:MAG: DUF2851 family protein [Chthoniobacterales bacterium]
MQDDYPSQLAAFTGSRIRDEKIPYFSTVSESEVQALWYSGQFGDHFQSVEGKEIAILDFGRWNHEAGPDFRDCEIQIDGLPSMRGDVEIDLDARSWERHEHAINPGYNNVVLHVFVTSPSARCFARTEAQREITQLQLHKTLEKKSSVKQRAEAHRMADWSDEKVIRFLENAARYRMELRGKTLSRIISAHGEKDALFQALAIALGYKNNQIPFLLLSQRSTLSRTKTAEGEALLFGLAGFLDGADFHLFDDRSRSYQRNLWDTWWSMRSGFERLILPPKSWSLSGCRPANHPHRRVAALACIGRRFNSIYKAFSSGVMEEVIRECKMISHPFWEQNWSLAADILPRRLSLLGEERISEILTNIFFPYRLVQFGEGWDVFCNRTESPYRLLRDDLFRFFGPRPELIPILRKCVIQQGLLQVAKDLRKGIF